MQSRDCCDWCKNNPNPEDQCPAHYKVVKLAYAKLKKTFTAYFCKASHETTS